MLEGGSKQGNFNILNHIIIKHNTIMFYLRNLEQNRGQFYSKVYVCN